MPERLAHVVPLAPVEGPFTYRVPPPLDAEAAEGARVVVPFGRRTLTGVVVGRSEGEGKDLKPILDTLDARPAFPPELLRLTRWISDYYCCAWREVLRCALPNGTEVEGRRVVTRLSDGMAWAGSPLGRKVLDALEDHTPTPLTELADALGRDVPAHLLRRLEAAGLVRVEEEIGEAKVRARKEKHVRLAHGIALDAVEGLRGGRQRAVFDVLALAHEDAAGDGHAAELRLADLLQQTGASSATVRALEQKQLVEIIEREVLRTAHEADEPLPATPPALTLHPGQHAALGAITEAVEAERAETFLLHGVTGSGKTEVYIQALKAALDRGRTALVLVPEIALTPQTVRRFRAHFGDQIAVLHSRMSPGERFDAWRALRDGRFAVAIGPRSAVLAPLENLGLVVVDEEHEGSYKQFDPAPRYHARDVAVMRAYLAGAVCVLGSATPSLESFTNARAGKYRLLKMPERVPVREEKKPAPLPTVRVVDLAREHKIRRLKGALSDALRDALAARLERGEQAILLQNRRGYAPVLTCEACGFTPRCRDCAVSLTVHKAHRHLRCHYCGRAERIPTTCLKCGSEELTFLGAGTQRVEEELAEVFPHARVLRMDLDTTARKGAHRRLLDAFGRGEADVLLGTQMVAKGLDFPRVTLVGVVNADTGMLLPDFRAAERTFQLLAQVAGRAGRADLPGEVILQTRNPDHPALRFALAHDYDGFARAELEEREALGYPPCGRLVGLEFKGPEEAAVRRLADQWTAALRKEGGSRAGVEVLGPAPAFVGRIKGQWRYHTLVKASRAVPVAALTHAVRAAEAHVGRPPKGCRVNVDVDPLGLY
ncbi:MAG TPA: primosomal protein N' [Rubricoccaceae bacterium]|nr:primosomal protein N' [Rubricoccaceae bacterium]